MQMETRIKKSKPLLISLLFFMLSCSSGIQGLKEPASNKTMLVVGRVIVEDKSYSDRHAVYKSGIDVAVVGKIKSGKEVGLWTTTDENGYFCVSNVPMGEYALKGVRLSIGRGDLVIIENRLSSSSDPYLLTHKTELIFNGDYFPFAPVGRIQNLQHTIFTLDYSNRSVKQVRCLTTNKLVDIKLFNGEVLNAGSVEEYFIQKYPESAWKQALEKSAEIVRLRR